MGVVGAAKRINAVCYVLQAAEILPNSGKVLQSTPSYTITCEFEDRLFSAIQPHTTFDVAAWHRDYYPARYGLRRPKVIVSTPCDHPDPSIFTVLTAVSGTPGTAIADFAVFPLRWLVAEDIFRPPWLHGT